MRINSIRSFLQLYHEMNISKASAQLFITQQGLSRQVQALEKELNVALFERSKSGMIPTPICEQLYPHFQKMYDEYATVLETIDAAGKEEKKSLSIAFAYGLSNCINTDFIFDYQKEHTEINMKIEEWSQSICIQKLLKGELQLAFLVTPIDQKLFRSFSLAEDYMFAAIHKNHPLAAEDTPFDFSRLDGEKIITGAPENALREMFDYFCEVTNISPRIIVSSSYSLNFVNAMTENAGIATVTSAMARRITNPDIVIRRLLTPEPGLMYCCTPHQTKCGKELTGLLRYVKRYFENMPEKRFKET